jgi:hypothetical protein
MRAFDHMSCPKCGLLRAIQLDANGAAGTTTTAPPVTSNASIQDMLEWYNIGAPANYSPAAYKNYDPETHQARLDAEYTTHGGRLESESFTVTVNSRIQMIVQQNP